MIYIHGSHHTQALLFPKIIDSSGDGVNSFLNPADFSIAVDGDGNVYVTGTASDNAFRISP